MCHILSKDDDAKVSLPNDRNKLDSYVGAVGRRHRLLEEERVCFACDGLKLPLEQAGDCVIQNMFYNGWTYDHYVSNVFVFAPDGTIVLMCINAPGAMHDSTIAHYGHMYDELEKMYLEYGVKTVVDSAFLSTRTEYLIQSS